MRRTRARENPSRIGIDTPAAGFRERVGDREAPVIGADDLAVGRAHVPQVRVAHETA